MWGTQQMKYIRNALFLGQWVLLATPRTIQLCFRDAHSMMGLNKMMPTYNTFLQLKTIMSVDAKVYIQIHCIHTKIIIFIEFQKFYRKVFINLLKLHYVIAPCEIPSYEVTTRQFRFGSGLLKHSVHGVYPDDRRLKVITITYEYAFVHHSEQHQLVNTHNFISQIGGNLGLFLGFSCFSTLLLFYSLIARWNSNAKTELAGNEIVWKYLMVIWNTAF